ncbi:unnamed protein product [Closterium sp. NIES-64]|nr:unnamed protein product [Closterium sp. NIES-64]
MPHISYLPGFPPFFVLTLPTVCDLGWYFHQVKLERQRLQSQADTLRAHLARHQAVQQQMESSWQQLRGSTDTLSALLRCNTTTARNPTGLGELHGSDDDDGGGAGGVGVGDGGGGGGWVNRGWRHRGEQGEQHRGEQHRGEQHEVMEGGNDWLFPHGDELNQQQQGQGQQQQQQQQRIGQVQERRHAQGGVEVQGREQGVLALLHPPPSPQHLPRQQQSAAHAQQQQQQQQSAAAAGAHGVSEHSRHAARGGQAGAARLGGATPHCLHAAAAHSPPPTARQVFRPP